MNEPGEDKIYKRDEILQVMYWMTGEGFGTCFSREDLLRFLDFESDDLEETLERLRDAELVEKDERGFYSLTAAGRREGGRRFADEFDEMLKPGHYECNDPDCDCHDPGRTEPCKNLHSA